MADMCGRDVVSSDGADGSNYSHYTEGAVQTEDGGRSGSDLPALSSSTSDPQRTFPVMADQTFSVLSSEPLTMRLPQNWRQVITWSS